MNGERNPQRAKIAGAEGLEDAWEQRELCTSRSRSTKHTSLQRHLSDCSFIGFTLTVPITPVTGSDLHRTAMTSGHIARTQCLCCYTLTYSGQINRFELKNNRTTERYTQIVSKSIKCLIQPINESLLTEGFTTVITLVSLKISLLLLIAHLVMMCCMHHSTNSKDYINNTLQCCDDTPQRSALVWSASLKQLKFSLPYKLNPRIEPKQFRNARLKMGGQSPETSVSKQL